MRSESQAVFDTLRPACLAEFLCDSNVCGSNCCAKGWGIAVDEEYYALYQRIPDEGIRRRVLDAMEQREDGTYVIKLSDNGACPLLEADGLCFLQKNMGEQYLSLVCALYPRVTYLIGDAASGSLTLTCPMAQELLLLGKEPMRLERVQAPLPRDACFPAQPKMGAAAFRIVQETTLSLLQQRLYTLDERLALAGFFVDCVDEALGKGAAENDLTEMADFYRTPAAGALLSHVRFDGTAHLRWIFGWMDEIKRHGWDGIFHVRRGAADEYFFNQVTEIYALREDNSSSRLLSLYEEYRALYREKFLPVHGHILEHYLVNEIFTSGFPCKYEGSLLVDWRALVARWKFLEFFLIAWTTTYDADVGEGEVLRLIECAEHSVLHVPLYTETWNAYLRRGEQELLPWMQQMLVCGEC